MKKGQGIISVLHNFLSRIVPSGRKRRMQNVGRVYSQKSEGHTLSKEKQKKLEEMCEKLFAQKKLLTTGKMQLIGLGKLKKKMGKTWPGLQKIVYETVEDAIAKYMMPGDLFIRYKDDNYVILYGNSSPEEAKIKSALMAEEIRRRLFEHEEEELRNLEIEESVTIVRTENLRSGKNLQERLGVISDNVSSPPPPVKKEAVPPPSPTIEIDPYTASKPAPPEKPVIPQRRSMLDVTYMPLWDTKKNLMTTYLCLIRGDNAREDPFDVHESFFAHASPSEKVQADIQVLQTVALELEAMAQDGRKLFIACPVQYETLYLGESYEKYILECQKIPQEQKKYLIFLLLGIPSNVHESNIYRFSVPLRKHCHAIYAQIPLDTRSDFRVIRECRFEAVGVRLHKGKGGEKHLLAALNSFAHKSKASLIGKIFALDVMSLSVTTSAVCAGFDYLGGPAIHECVVRPDNVYRYRHENLFTDLLKEQQG